MVLQLPMKVVIGDDIFGAHQCTLQYLPNDSEQLILGKEDCATCNRNLGEEQSGLSAQVRQLNEVARRRTNRARVGQTFISTLQVVETSIKKKTSLF